MNKMSEDTMSFKTQSSNSEEYILDNSFNAFQTATSIQTIDLQQQQQEQPNQFLTFSLPKKIKQITKKSQKPVQPKRKSKIQINSQNINTNNYPQQFQESENQTCSYSNSNQTIQQPQLQSAGWIEFSHKDDQEKLTKASILDYQVRSRNKFYLSSCKVISMDWFAKDPNTIFDMELYSEFSPVERVIHHKKEGVVELSQQFEQYPPDNIEYVIHCLKSTSSQKAHYLAELLTLSNSKRLQYQAEITSQNREHINILNYIDIAEIKRLALDLIELQDTQKIFVYNIFIRDPQDDSLKKVSQGYSEGFLKMMGVSISTFSSFVMKHKGFEAFSGQSRMNTLSAILCKELGLEHDQKIEDTAQVKTFDDYILQMTPSTKILPLSESRTCFLTINSFDMDVDQLIKLESLRKKERNSLFQQDFRYQCQVQNFIEKFYPTNTNTTYQQN